MTNIEIFIFVLLAVLFLFDLYVYYTIYKLEKNISELKSKLNTQSCIQEEIVKKIKTHLNVRYSNR